MTTSQEFLSSKKKWFEILFKLRAIVFEKLIQSRFYMLRIYSNFCKQFILIISEKSKNILENVKKIKIRISCYEFRVKKRMVILLFVNYVSNEVYPNLRPIHYLKTIHK